MDVKMDHRTDARKETNILISPKPTNPKKSKEVRGSEGKCGEHSPGKCGEVRGSAGKCGDSKQHK